MIHSRKNPTMPFQDDSTACIYYISSSQRGEIIFEAGSQAVMKRKGDTIPKQPTLLSIFRTKRKSGQGVTFKLQRKLRDH